MSTNNEAAQNKVEFTEYTYLNQAIDYLIDFLRVADEYLLEDVKI